MADYDARSRAHAMAQAALLGQVLRPLSWSRYAVGANSAAYVEGVGDIVDQSLVLDALCSRISQYAALSAGAETATDTFTVITWLAHATAAREAMATWGAGVEPASPLTPTSAEFASVAASWVAARHLGRLSYLYPELAAVSDAVDSGAALAAPELLRLTPSLAAEPRRMTRGVRGVTALTIAELSRLTDALGAATASSYLTMLPKGRGHHVQRETGQLLESLPWAVLGPGDVPLDADAYFVGFGESVERLKQLCPTLAPQLEEIYTLTALHRSPVQAAVRLIELMPGLGREEMVLHARGHQRRSTRELGRRALLRPSQTHERRTSKRPGREG